MNIPDTSLTATLLLDSNLTDLPTEESQDNLLAELGGVQLTAHETTSADPTPAVPSSHYSPGISTSIEERAMTLLGSGVNADSVANALGVTPSRISQLLAEKTFASKVSALRYESLQKHNKRDGRYDTLEDKLITKLEKSLPLLIRPESILKAISVVSGVKRRGQSTPEQVTNQQNIVNIILPQVIKQKFAIDINNQVIKAGDQELHTMPSGNLLKQVEDAEEARTNTSLSLEHDSGGT